jgi:plasmid stability protein
MANTSMMTLRIDRELVSELKVRARQQNRSMSAEVVHILRNSLHAGGAKMRSKFQTPSMGMFAQFEAPSAQALADATESIRQSMAASIQASAYQLNDRGRARRVKRKP